MQKASLFLSSNDFVFKKAFAEDHDLWASLLSAARDMPECDLGLHKSLVKLVSI